MQCRYSILGIREGASLRQSESKLEPKLNLNLSESKTSPKALQNKKNSSHVKPNTHHSGGTKMLAGKLLT